VTKRNHDINSVRSQHTVRSNKLQWYWHDQLAVTAIKIGINSIWRVTKIK